MLATWHVTSNLRVAVTVSAFDEAYFREDFPQSGSRDHFTSNRTRYSNDESLPTETQSTQVPGVSPLVLRLKM